MSFILYHLIILPLEYLIEVVFTLSYRFFAENTVPALLVVSLFISFLTLPLYLKADGIQEVEQQKQRQMEPWLKHIRSSFKKDERYMIQAAYYREQGYRPLHAIKGVLSLILQIPFFIAAYHYLSTCSFLQAVSFGSITDLGQEDALLVLGERRINVLPVIMTGINLCSGYIYTKEYSRSQKIQVVVLPLLFLFLLYHSPSGLVIYWTINNLFSLCKNIIMKVVKHKKRLIGILFCILEIVYIFGALLTGNISRAVNERDYELLMIYLFIGICIFIPAWKAFFKGYIKMLSKGDFQIKSGVSDYILVVMGISILFGLSIPLSVIASSPQDFVNPVYYRNPLYFVFTTFLSSVGIFGVWGMIIYVMLDSRKKNNYVICLFGLLISLAIIPITCNAEVGSMSKTLVFSNVPHFPALTRYGNMVVVVVSFGLACFLWMKTPKLCRSAVLVMTASFLFISLRNLISVQQELKKMSINQRIQEEVTEFPLSKYGNNVVVIMLDAAIGAYLPFIMEERPELKEVYDGFCYYPNTVSTGLFTNYGAPGLFGGYEYTTGAINQRNNESLMDKYDEAIKVMPVTFGEEGYHVTIADVPYAGYQVNPDYSVYDEYDYVNAFHYADHMTDEGSIDETWKKMERNFFFYSVYKTAPAMVQDNIYDQSNYLCGTGKAAWYSDDLKLQYNALVKMQEHTVIREDDRGELIMYVNMTSHDPSMLALPDYEMPTYFDNTRYSFSTDRVIGDITMNLDSGKEWAVEYYHVNCAALLRLGEWINYLKQQGVYDNTRIIIVSDHGRALGQFEDLTFCDGVDAEVANALLLVKDFNSRGFSVDQQFMTNADVPTIAMDGIINHQSNPFTGQTINMDGKSDGIDVFWGTDFNLTYGNVFEPKDAPWYHVFGDIYDKNNWEMKVKQNY